MIAASRFLGLTTFPLLLAIGLFFPGPAAAPPPSIPFDEARLILEYNATDGDAEIVLDVDADVGLERFRVISPDGRQVLDLRARDCQELGIRKIRLETPEPSLEEVLEAYPEGLYHFRGKSVDGQVLVSDVWLSHELPAAPTITFPLDGAVGVPTNGSGTTWTAGADAASFFLEIEQDDLGVDVHSNIPGGATSFGFPAGWLIGDTEYQLGIATRSENGNLTVVEMHFTTGS
ncbi:MAG: hypothetical protein ACKVXR_04145 [Planctomycetota bacterium]